MLPPYSFVVEKVVLPNLAIFGWGVIVAETALAVLILSGAWIRAAALLGIGQSLAIGLSVAYAPNEWPWAYLLMLGAHIVLLTSSSGRYLAVDGIRAGLSGGRTLSRVAGGTAVVVGLYSIAGSFGDPLAANGPQIGTSSLEVGLGGFNLVGGLVIAVVGGLLLASERTGAAAAYGALGLALVAAISCGSRPGSRIASWAAAARRPPSSSPWHSWRSSEPGPWPQQFQNPPLRRPASARSTRDHRHRRRKVRRRARWSLLEGYHLDQVTPRAGNTRWVASPAAMCRPRRWSERSSDSGEG